MSRERALVVGGDPTDQTLAAILLRREGFDVAAARDGAEALAATREGGARFALVDAACVEAARVLEAHGVLVAAIAHPLDARAIDEALARVRAVANEARLLRPRG